VFDLLNGTWEQSAKLEANDGEIDDSFGHSVSLNGDRALIGAYLDDDNANDSGSAYVFELSGNSWIQTAKINSSDTAESDHFGFAVSLLGNRALIGAFLTDENFNNSGSAYIFELDAGVWSQTKKLVGTNPAENDWMGYSVSLGIDRALIGSRLDGENGIDTGSATVFDYSSNNWTQTVELFADDANAGDQFGISVSLSGDRLIVGSPLNDGGGLNNGAAYIFDLVSNMWEQTIKITPNDMSDNDSFGQSVAIIDGRALVSSALDDDNGIDSGSAYLFDLVLGNWIQSGKLIASNGGTNDSFGTSVSLSENRILIGAHLNNDIGSSYVFKLDERPLAVNDTFTVIENSPATLIDVLSNDIDNDGGINEIIAVTQALNGTVEFSNQIVSYKPNLEYCNDESIKDNFSYSLNGGSTAEVNVNVICTYKLGGTISGLSKANPVILQNNLGDDLLLNNNGDFEFLLQQLDSTIYSVSVLSEPTSPNQTCIIENNSGIINQSDIKDIIIDCNTAPSVSNDSFIALEDGILTIDAGVIFENDNDVESDKLTVLNSGIFNTDGISGLMFIENDGSFEFLPSNELFGKSTFTYEVSDGINSVFSTIFIDTQAVNDAPNFSIMGDIDATTSLNGQNHQMVIPQFVTQFDFGPENESSQQILQFNLEVYSDFNSILNSISINNEGTLFLDFSKNYGAAIIKINLQDNGGTTNNGIDTSENLEFIVSYTDWIFDNGFEENNKLAVSDIFSQVNENLLYGNLNFDSSNDRIFYLGHKLTINRELNKALLKSIISNWALEVLTLKHHNPDD